MLKFALSVLLLCVIEAQARHGRCYAPPAWEGNMQEIAFKKKELVNARLSVDAWNRRTRTVERVIHGERQDLYDILYYQRYKVMFIVNIKERNCTRIRVDYPWKPSQIPDDATFVGFAIAGTNAIPGAGMEVQSWTGNFTHADVSWRWFSTLTVRGCLPLSMSVFSDKYGLSSSSFYDLTLGISNPNVFHPPKECWSQGQVTEEDMREFRKADLNNYSYRLAPSTEENDIL